MNSRVQLLLDSLSKEDISSILCSSLEQLSALEMKDSGIEKLNLLVDLSVFMTIKSFSPQEYLNRILTYISLEKSTLILAFILIDKVSSYCISIIREDTILKLLIGAVTCATKYNQDIGYTDKDYATVFGITSTTFLQIETAFLQLIDYSVYVSLETWTLYLENIYQISNSDYESSDVEYDL
eukprot:CAMPEP_0170529476 /NCGR_PEP_ID=MMETSP0209-20121228/23979_1 /TAXON_ID=665100 ORGANISM="Litonotus pictus, Strain P1" /NCGR_SAMPLE_ID=MMETSP0209 /ASSEMBLY_ACC=CAM_ASM_000301 /LENGTH=181 /DNA_ID=CAMNT_0010821477 /DNA_START=17 /DNA_END=562 /DNA_ORIENTATION=+